MAAGLVVLGAALQACSIFNANSRGNIGIVNKKMSGWLDLLSRSFSVANYVDRSRSSVRMPSIWGESD
jgi:hypothetical protein